MTPEQIDAIVAAATFAIPLAGISLAAGFGWRMATWLIKLPGNRPVEALAPDAKPEPEPDPPAPIAARLQALPRVHGDIPWRDARVLQLMGTKRYRRLASSSNEASNRADGTWGGEWKR